MKKIFTLIAVAMMSIGGAMAQTETVTLCNPDKLKQNTLSGAELGAPEGWTLQCMNEAKNLESGSEFNIGETKYRAIKFSNGAQNTVTLPEGKVATKVIFYSTVNKDEAARPAYWKEVNGVTYSEEEAKIMVSFKDYDNPDINSYDLNRVSSFTFTNTGEQPFAIIVVEYTTGTGISNITAAEDTDAPAYNLAGQKVGANYKGLVIKNGKKYVNK